MNLANKLTMMRIILVPIFLIFIAVKEIPYGSIIATIVFIVASITDQLDGYIARSRNQITNFGKFMDPLADKLLVTAALVSLSEMHLISGWIVVVIIAREFAVSGLRTLAASDGIIIAASWWGKLKTVTQMAAIITLLLKVNIGVSQASIDFVSNNRFLNVFFTYVPNILLILAVIALLSRNQLSIGGGFLSSGYSLIYGVGFISVLFRGFLLGFLSILYIGTKKEYEESNIYLGIFKQSIKTVALGYLIVFVLLVIGHLIGLSYVYEFGISNSISNINVFVVISQLAAYIWGFANFNIATIGSQSLFLPSLFKTSLSIDFKLCLIAFVALSALILFISGIKLNNKYKTSSKKPVLIFSVFYAVIMASLSIFTYVNINGGSLLGYNIAMNTNVILTLIMSFIYSFIVTFVGFKLSNWD